MSFLSLDETGHREIEYGTALYDFTGTATDELSFRKGDKIEITERVSEDWLRGKHNGREGMLPRVFVQLLTVEPGTSSFIGNQSSYFSNRPQVTMVYGLINHARCWQNTRRIRKSRAAGEAVVRFVNGRCHFREFFNHQQIFLY